MINLNNTTPAAPSGQQNAAWQQDTSGNVSCNVPIPSVALSAPAEFTVSGSPVLGSGTLTFAKANQNANLVWAGPSSGAAAAPTFRALVAADLPSGVGTVSSVALSAPAEFTVSGSPVTTSGTLTFAKATQSANLVWAGPTSGSAAAPTFRALVAADMPSGFGVGTVTSVALSAPAEFTVSGSPVTGSGTLTFAKATQSANLLWAGPSSGSAAAPTFRSLVAADLVANIPIYVGAALPGKPSASQTVALWVMPINGTFAAAFSGSTGSVGTNPTATATYTVNQNGSSLGTISISTAGAFTFSLSSSTNFSAGDRFTIVAPSTQDATLSDVAITLQAARR